MAKFWMHNGLMKKSAEEGKLGGKGDRESAANEVVEEANVDTKISRSKNDGGLRELIARQTGERIRFFLLRTHYRSTSVFGEEPLEEAGLGLEKFYVFFERYERINKGLSFYLDPDESIEKRKLIARRADGDFAGELHDLLKKVAEIRDTFLAKMDDDFNTGGATSELFQLLSLLNKFAADAKLEESSPKEADLIAFNRAVETLRELSALLGLFFKSPRKTTSSGADAEVVEGLMQLLIQLRADARANKDFATGDRIREGLGNLGIILEDRKGDTGWKQE